MGPEAAGGDEVPTSPSKEGQAPRLPFRRLCSLSLHDASSFTEDILVNTSLFPAQSVRAGDIMQIVAVDGFEKHHSGAVGNFHVDTSRTKPTGEAEGGDRNTPAPLINLQSYDALLSPEKTNIFVVKSMGPEMLSKQPSIEVSHHHRSFQDCR